MSKHIRTLTVCSSLVALAAFSGGCSSSSDESGVGSRLEIINRTKSALVDSTVTAIHGTYAGSCQGRASNGSEQWIVDRGVPANTSLTVVKNDVNCVLTLTSLDAGGQSYLAAPAIGMDGAWKSGGTPFALASGGDTSLKFYGNAMLSATTFTDDFVISLLVSDSASFSGDEKGASYATRSATLESETVPASNYGLSFGGFYVQKDIQNVVDSATGSAQLTPNPSVATITGEDYAVHDGALDGTSLADVETAFAGSAHKGLVADLTTGLLPAAWFDLEALDLDSTPTRTVIIRHTDRGISSYQLLVTMFTP